MTFRQKYLYGKDPIEINAGRRTLKVTVSNTGDRAVQIGSHYHFFEVNSALSFDREETLGMHLNIPAGTSVRFEPGGSREVELCAYGGTGRLIGFSGLLNGSLASHPARVEAVRKAIEQGFQGAQSTAAQSTGAGKPASKSAARPAAKPARPAAKPARPAAKPAKPAAKPAKPAAKPAKAAKEKKKGSR
ncbi:urease subunit beta [Streptomyces sp. NBC_00341]|uniref:urease subunit beta n=1 Tax=Streptomyces sp. NBC_00341 TaxID=2975717 RepID=UPI0030885D89|nr:urease subunit beta [Streptomyces sp. NBC_00341]